VADPLPLDPHPLDWSLLRDFLAVAGAGSLSAGARRLSVSQPTLTRRMSALEERLGTALFARTPRGLQLTEAGEALLEPARRVGEEIRELEQTVSGRDAALAGTVRISTTEGLGVRWLTPALIDFQRANPEICIELGLHNQLVDLLRREADIALRIGRPRQSDLVARKGADLVLGLYASRAYLDRAGRPRSLEDLRGHQCVAFDEALRHRGPGAWLEARVAASRVVFRSNSLSAQLAAIRAGYGIGAQARVFVDDDPGLERVLPEVEARVEIWLVTHAGLRRSARIRAVYDFLAERLSAARAAFAPDPPAPRKNR